MSGGIIISETTEFVRGIGQADQESKEPGAQLVSRVHGGTIKSVPASVTSMAVDDVEEETSMGDAMDVDSSVESELSEQDLDFIEERLVGSGIAGALALLKQKGALRPQEEALPSPTTSRSSIAHIGGSSQRLPQIQLEYTDAQGNHLTPKEAFRQLSHRFHGKLPGKMKTEKRLKKIAAEAKANKLVEKTAKIADALHRKQKAAGSAYIVLGGSKS